MDLETQFAALRVELNAALTDAAVAEEAAAASGTEASARHAAEAERLMAERDATRAELDKALADHQQGLKVCMPAEEGGHRSNQGQPETV